MRMVAHVAAILAVAAALAAGPAAAQVQPSVEVQLTTLKRGQLPRIVTAYGTVEPSSSSLRTVTAPAAAIVDEIDVHQGEKVEKDAPLLRLSPSPASQSSYTQARSALHVAEDMVARMRTMVRQRLATAQQLADAEKAETDARAALAALDAQGAGGAKVLKAPVGAVVTAISTNPGALVAEGSALLTLADPTALVLRVGVVPAQAAAIAPNDPAAISALGDASTLSSTVTLRGAMVDPATGLIPVQIALPPGKFLPGEAALAKITTGDLAGYIVPHEAILVDDHGHPYVVQALNMTAKKVPVRILGADGDQDVIDGALDLAAPLVLAGNYQLEDGMKMRIAGPAGRPAP